MLLRREECSCAAGGAARWYAGAASRCAAGPAAEEAGRAHSRSVEVGQNVGGAWLPCGYSSSGLCPSELLFCVWRGER